MYIVLHVTIDEIPYNRREIYINFVNFFFPYFVSTEFIAICDNFFFQLLIFYKLNSSKLGFNIVVVSTFVDIDYVSYGWDFYRIKIEIS